MIHVIILPLAQIAVTGDYIYKIKGYANIFRSLIAGQMNVCVFFWKYLVDMNIWIWYVECTRPTYLTDEMPVEIKETATEQHT